MLIDAPCELKLGEYKLVLESYEKQDKRTVLFTDVIKIVVTMPVI